MKANKYFATVTAGEFLGERRFLELEVLNSLGKLRSNPIEEIFAMVDEDRNGAVSSGEGNQTAIQHVFLVVNSFLQLDFIITMIHIWICQIRILGSVVRALRFMSCHVCAGDCKQHILPKNSCCSESCSVRPRPSGGSHSNSQFRPKCCKRTRPNVLESERLPILIQMVCFCSSGKGAPILFKSSEPKPSFSQSHH
jgi:hypothetical protein